MLCPISKKLLSRPLPSLPKISEKGNFLSSFVKLCKDFDLFTFQLKQTYIGEDLCEQIRDKFPVSLGEATEANFYKAYDECVRLFKEEE